MPTDIIQLQDFGETNTQKDTPEGYLLVNANLAKPGILEYYAGELPRDSLPDNLQDEPMTVVRLLRPVEEVFKPESISSYNLKPVTNDHPPQFVNAKNYSKFQVGMTTQNAAQRDGFLNADFLIQDAESVAAVKNGKRQISSGYRLQIEWGAGIHDVHGPYDGRQVNIMANHVAIVDKGRAGAQVRINDSWQDTPGAKQSGDTMAVTREVKGLSVEFSGQGAQAVDGLMDSLKAETAKSAEMAVKLTDAEKKVDELQGKLDAEKANQITDAQIEELVAARVALVDRAKTLHPEIDCAGKDPKAIKVECIVQLKDGFPLEGKSDDYINAVFDTLDAPKGDTGLKTLTTALEDNHKDSGTPEEPMVAAYANFAKLSRDAWKGEQV
jgi:hypothetical protein